MLKYRLLTAGVLLPLAICLIFFVPYKIYFAVITIAYLLSVWEWSHLLGTENSLIKACYRLLMLLILGLFYYLLNTHQDHVVMITATQVFSLPAFYVLLCLTLNVFGFFIACYFVVTYPRTEKYWGNPWMIALKSIWILVPWWLSLIVLRESVYGPWAVMFALMIVILADSGAYFSGRLWGKHKLAARVSPGKTWEGVLGGILISVVITSAYASWFMLSKSDGELHFSFDNLLVVIIIVLVIAAISVLGDLNESMLKRYAGVKDSGSLLPGHGGILDRIDGLTFALPILAWILTWLDLALK